MLISSNLVSFFKVSKALKEYLLFALHCEFHKHNEIFAQDFYDTYNGELIKVNCHKDLLLIFYLVFVREFLYFNSKWYI